MGTSTLDALCTKHLFLMPYLCCSSFLSLFFVGWLTLFISDEWDNFLERIGRGESTGDADLQESSSDALELRFWASYRGQTLARTGQ